MTDVLRSSSYFPSSPSSSLSCAPTPNDDARQSHHSLINHHPCSSSPAVEDREEQKQRVTEGDNLSLLALWVTSVRKYLIACRTEREELCPMEIGSPTNVRHVAHVTFDRFNGFLGLPLEFEPEVPRRAPSASANVFGVKTESMQCSYDSRGNSVPTILLLMQSRLYAQGGLQAEGIFRINAENSQEEYVRDQLNRGVVPDGIDVHCLAGLIKAWFRELPTGVLDPLAPEKVMQCKSEEECAQLVKLLPPMEASLLDWAINLMADVVEKEHQSKMNARNIAMVFAPNMTQMADPLIALMYAVQVMNFLKTLIERILREREDSILKSAPTSHLEPSDENGHHSPSLPCLEEEVTHEKEESENVFISDKPLSESPSHTTEDDSTTENGAHSCQSSVKNCSCEVPNQADILANGPETSINGLKHGKVRANTNKNRTAQSSDSNHRKGTRKVDRQPVVCIPGPLDKSKGSTIITRINSRTERVGVWR